MMTVMSICIKMVTVKPGLWFSMRLSSPWGRRMEIFPGEWGLLRRAADRALCFQRGCGQQICPAGFYSQN